MKPAPVAILESLEQLKSYKYYVIYFDETLMSPQWVSFADLKDAQKLSDDRKGVVMFGEYIEHSKKKDKK